ncbi:hypothetical protein OG547_35630 (plasmid) [Streptomyces longwoodensis]|uniref:hypothetical protein n=1 Tax=Streptomyces longwoodensis TaxID=68231 RepID=UPI002ED244C0|nr:hypothetical protein OG547_35630 [Streptomyces longwoodensis]
MFAALNISVRRYAVRIHRNPGAVSRYLNGTRVPSWDFVMELFTEVAKAKQAPLQKDVIAHIREAHRKALQSSNKRLYEVQRLQDQLEDADLRVQQASIREQVLLEGLHMREQRIAQLETKQVEIAARLQHEFELRESIGAELTRAQESHSQELERLRAEVEQLRGALELAKQASDQAEERCRQLENRLIEAEEKARAGQEAREASELQAAQRAAAEARALADELRQKLDDLQNEVRAPRSTVTERMKATVEVARQQAEKKKAYYASAPPEEIARELIRRHAMDGDIGVHDLALSVAALAPVEVVLRVCKILWEKGYTEMSEDLAGDVTSRESLDSVADFLVLVGSRDTSRFASTLILRVVNQFAWFRSSPDVPRLMSTLKNRGWDAWSSQIQEECAIRRDPDRLAELLSIMDDADKGEMLTAICNSRSAPDIPALLSHMTKAELGDDVQSILAQIADVRPNDHSSIIEAWELVNE